MPQVSWLASLFFLPPLFVRHLRLLVAFGLKLELSMSKTSQNVKGIQAAFRLLLERLQEIQPFALESAIRVYRIERLALLRDPGKAVGFSCHVLRNLFRGLIPPLSHEEYSGAIYGKYRRMAQERGRKVVGRYVARLCSIGIHHINIIFYSNVEIIIK